MQTEFCKFFLLITPCCHTMLCWINPRMPNFCPECGRAIWLKKQGEHILFLDSEARLIHKNIP